MRSPVFAALIICLPVGFVPLFAHASGATLINNELLEMRYADGVRKPVGVAWVRQPMPTVFSRTLANGGLKVMPCPATKLPCWVIRCCRHLMA